MMKFIFKKISIQTYLEALMAMTPLYLAVILIKTTALTVEAVTTNCLVHQAMTH